MARLVGETMMMAHFRMTHPMKLAYHPTNQDDERFQRHVLVFFTVIFYESGYHCVKHPGVILVVPVDCITGS